jgi:hypothetical protein
VWSTSSSRRPRPRQWPSRRDASAEVRRRRLNAGINKGWGDLEGPLQLHGLVRAQRAELDRRVAATSRGCVLPFSQNGVNYLFNQATRQHRAGQHQSFKAYLTGGNPSQAKTYSINPFYRANGNCGNPALTACSRIRREPGHWGDRRILPVQLRRDRQDIPANEQNALVLNGT